MISFEWSIVIAAILLAVVAGIGMTFRRILGRIDGLSTSERIQAWDVFAKVVTTFTAIAVGLIAFIRYIDQRELERESQLRRAAETVREFNIQIYGESKSTEQAKRVFLNEVADLASTLATSTDLQGPTASIAFDRFERLYHGQLVLYENEEVSDRMIDFRDAMLKWSRTGEKPTVLAPDDRSNTKTQLEFSKHNSDFMRRLALQLSAACERQLRTLEPELPASE